MIYYKVVFYSHDTVRLVVLHSFVQIWCRCWISSQKEYGSGSHYRRPGVTWCQKTFCLSTTGGFTGVKVQFLVWCGKTYGSKVLIYYYVILHYSSICRTQISHFYFCFYLVRIVVKFPWTDLLRHSLTVIFISRFLEDFRVSDLLKETWTSNKSFFYPTIISPIFNHWDFKKYSIFPFSGQIPDLLDWTLRRRLWMNGLEPKLKRLGEIFRRFICSHRSGMDRSIPTEWEVYFFVT